MSLKSLKAEIKRLTEQAGIDDEAVVLIVLAVVSASGEPMDLPDTVGHVVDYRIEGKNLQLYFPLCEMASAEAEEMAKAMIVHVWAVEGKGRRGQIGIMDMCPFPRANSWRFKRPPAGVSINEYVSDQYHQIIEARHEHA